MRLHFATLMVTVLAAAPLYAQDQPIANPNAPDTTQCSMMLVQMRQACEINAQSPQCAAQTYMYNSCDKNALAKDGQGPCAGMLAVMKNQCGMSPVSAACLTAQTDYSSCVRHN